MVGVEVENSSAEIIEVEDESELRRSPPPPRLWEFKEEVVDMMLFG